MGKKRIPRADVARRSTPSLRGGSSHGKSIVGQFHRPGKILLLSFPPPAPWKSLSLPPAPPISPFISRRSAYSYSPNALFLDLRARIAEEDVNKQDHYSFVRCGCSRVSVRPRSPIFSLLSLRFPRLRSIISPFTEFVSTSFPYHARKVKRIPMKHPTGSLLF